MGTHSMDGHGADRPGLDGPGLKEGSGSAAGHGAAAEGFSRESYDQRYASVHALWSGNPNPQLVQEAASLSPGRALDAGCGEGADAIWLAGRGWHVTAVDFSEVALTRAAEHAADEGAEVSSRIDFLQRELGVWTPEPAAFNLVSAQFLQLPRAQRDVVFTALASAVAPGGTLLMVGHSVSDLEGHVHRPPSREVYFTAEELADTILEPDTWDIVACGSRARIVQPDGAPSATVHDAVLRAARRR